MRQRISLTLAEAAKATGLSEAAILGAIEAGRIAGMKDMQDVWHVDRAALCHAFPSARAAAAQSDSGNGRPLDAATLVLEVGMSALVRQAGDKLRWRPEAGRNPHTRTNSRGRPWEARRFRGSFLLPKFLVVWLFHLTEMATATLHLDPDIRKLPACGHEFLDFCVLYLLGFSKHAASDEIRRPYIAPSTTLRSAVPDQSAHD
jgi:hypothetical protein